MIALFKTCTQLHRAQGCLADGCQQGYVCDQSSTRCEPTVGDGAGRVWRRGRQGIDDESSGGNSSSSCRATHAGMGAHVAQALAGVQMASRLLLDHAAWL